MRADVLPYHARISVDVRPDSFAVRIVFLGTQSDLDAGISPVIMNEYITVMGTPIVLRHTDHFSIGRTSFVYECPPSPPPPPELPSPIVQRVSGTISPNIVSDREDDPEESDSGDDDDDDDEEDYFSEEQLRRMRRMARVGQNSTTGLTSRYYANMLPTAEKRVKTPTKRQ
jgi:hypothetical protein